MDTWSDDADVAIRTRNLSKRFGAFAAVSEMNLEVRAGAIYGFLGRNGAGKTTTIRLLLGLLRPSGGAVRVFGRDVARDRLGAARLTSSLLEARSLYDNLSGRDNLDAARRCLGLPAREIDRVLDVVDLGRNARRKVGQYSMGMRQRLGLARAMLGAPRLLVLDEPMNGLDPDGIRDMRNVISELPTRYGVTVFLSSHILAEIQHVATHVGLMQDGRLVLTGAIGDLLARVPSALYLRTTNAHRAIGLLRSCGYEPVPDGAGLRLAMTGTTAGAGDINRRLVEAGIEVTELTPRQATLETLFLHTQQSTAGAVSSC